MKHTIYTITDDYRDRIFFDRGPVEAEIEKTKDEICEYDFQGTDEQWNTLISKASLFPTKDCLWQSARYIVDEDRQTVTPTDGLFAAWLNRLVPEGWKWCSLAVPGKSAETLTRAEALRRIEELSEELPGTDRLDIEEGRSSRENCIKLIYCCGSETLCELSAGTNSERELAELESRIRRIYWLMHPSCPQNVVVGADHVLDEVEEIIANTDWQPGGEEPETVEAYVKWNPVAVIALRERLYQEWPDADILVDQSIRGEEDDRIDGSPEMESQFFETLQRIRKEVLEQYPDE